MQAGHTAEVFSLPASKDTQHHSGHQNNGGITFLTTDNKNRVLAVIDNDGVCGRRIHTKLKIKIIVHVTLLPTDILHHPRGQ